MSKCEACYKAEATTEIKHGDYTLQVCPECKDKHAQEQVYNKIQPLVEILRWPQRALPGHGQEVV